MATFSCDHIYDFIWGKKHVRHDNTLKFTCISSWSIFVHFLESYRDTQWDTASPSCTGAHNSLATPSAGVKDRKPSVCVLMQENDPDNWSYS